MLITTPQGDARLWYSDTGGDGPPILCHHGYMGSHDIWLPVVERLGDHGRWVLMDARGAGDSERTGTGYTVDQAVDDILAVADHVGLDRFTYVGHSMGGALGYRLALEHPDRIERLVLVCAAPPRSSPAPAPALERVVQAWRTQDADAMFAALAAGQPGPPDAVEMTARAARALSASAGHVEALAASMKTFDVLERLDQLALPVMLLIGGADPALRPNLEAYLQLPNAGLSVLDGVGHVPPVEAPDRFAAVVARFLREGVLTARTLREARSGEHSVGAGPRAS
jgi:pimeloyl-ACP methyl ester carboxylesterase